MELLTDIRYIQHLLGKEGVSPNHSAGQNFLVAPEVIEAALLSAKGGPKNITELGSGLGSLTQSLIMAGYHVRGIEWDKHLVAILRKVLPTTRHPNLAIVQGDLRKVAWEQSEAYQIMGNIPYNLSGLIFRRLTHLDPAPERAIFLVQKEVALRVAAHAPDMNLLGLSIALWGQATIVLRVPPTCFWPEPAVESTLLIITPHIPPLYSPEKREAILKTAKLFFQGKRKQIGGVIRRQWQRSPEDLIALRLKFGISPRARAENLSVQNWEHLHHFLTEL